MEKNLIIGLVGSHEDILAPALLKRALAHPILWFNAEGQQSVTCTASHVHAWLLFTRPHEETLLVLLAILNTARAHHILVVVCVDELNRSCRLALLLLCFTLIGLLIFTFESGTGFLASISLLIPVHAEPNKVLSELATLFGRREEHIVENGVDSRA